MGAIGRRHAIDGTADIVHFQKQMPIDPQPIKRRYGRLRRKQGNHVPCPVLFNRAGEVGQSADDNMGQFRLPLTLAVSLVFQRLMEPHEGTLDFGGGSGIE